MTGWQEKCPVGERRAGAVLARLIDARGAVPVTELVSGISGYPTALDDATRCLEDDLELLASMGLRTERAESAEPAYRIARGCWQARPLVLDTIDQALLGRAIELSGPAEGDLADAVAALAEKADHPHTDTTVSLSPRGSAARGRPEAYSRLHRLAGLMDRRVTVGFDYPSATGEIVAHQLQVGGLGETRGVWYAVGWEPGSPVVRAFSVSEMRGPVRELDEGGSYEIPRGFDLAEHLALGWRLGPDPFWARVRFDATLATYATSVLVQIPLEQTGDGCLDAEVPVGDLDGFIGWVLSFGTHARVIAPDEAVQRTREILEQAVAQHE